MVVEVHREPDFEEPGTGVGAREGVADIGPGRSAGRVLAHRPFSRSGTWDYDKQARSDMRKAPSPGTRVPDTLGATVMRRPCRGRRGSPWTLPQPPTCTRRAWSCHSTWHLGSDRPWCSCLPRPCRRLRRRPVGANWSCAQQVPGVAGAVLIGVALVEGGGAAARSLTGGFVGGASAYHSFTPLCPLQAPFLSVAVEYVPSLHIPMLPAGASAGAAANALAVAIAPDRQTTLRNSFMQSFSAVIAFSVGDCAAMCAGQEGCPGCQSSLKECYCLLGIRI